MIANPIYQLLHPAVAPGTASPTSTTEPSTSTINVPCQVMEQLSTFFQLFSHQVATPAECLMVFIAMLLLIFLVTLHMALDMIPICWFLSIDITHTLPRCI